MYEEVIVLVSKMNSNKDENILNNTLNLMVFMYKDLDKERLKEKSLTDIEGVLEEIKNKLREGSNLRDSVIHLIGRIKNLKEPEKLYEIVKFSFQKEGKKVRKKEIIAEIVSYYFMEKNRIRHALFAIINELDRYH